MKMFNRFIYIIIIIAIAFVNFVPVSVSAISNDVNDIVDNMSNEEKIAMLMMPAFRKYDGANVTELNANITSLIQDYGFAGVILFGENTNSIEGTMRLIDSLQYNNSNHISQLFIALDQEGGYVNRLGVSTAMPGNMAIAATGNENNAFESGKIIGSELSALGFNVDFAPVVDVNSNPKNPVIGVRSFSDDAQTVAKYSRKMMDGLHSQGIITSLKHFPGHGDTSNDTHISMAIVNKTYEELKNSDLLPFKELIAGGTEMIMTSHISYPNIATEKFTKGSEEYTMPATLSKTILTDILRGDMNYKGVIVSDALNMDAISGNFTNEEAAIKAINAGVNILLMPYTVINSESVEGFRNFISSLASKVGTEIELNRVNESVKKVLALKMEKGLLSTYNNANLEAKITNAKKIVSSKDNHDKEFEMAKKAVTLIKNDNNILPLKDSDKTLILYVYGDHVKITENVVDLLYKDNIISNKSNIISYDLTEEMSDIKNIIDGVNNVIVINRMTGYTGYSALNGFVFNLVDEVFEYSHEKGVNTILLSSHLPYDAARFKNADAIVATYMTNGINYNLNNYNSQYPIYGANVIAGLYKIFETNGHIYGRLPVNVYDIVNKELTNNILYKRGYGLDYYHPEDEFVYEILDGANQKLDLLGNSNLVVKTNGDTSKLIKLLVDNEELNKKYYKIKKGSTIATIDSSYLNTLSIGEHELTFIYEDGKVSTKFMLFENKVDTPNTYDEEIYYFITGIMSLLGLCSILYLRRTNN